MKRTAALHSEHLATSGRFGALAARRFTGGAIYWDASSHHASLEARSDGAALLLRGGYVAGNDSWLSSGLHSTEDPTTWGEFAVIRIGFGDVGSEVRAWADPAGSWPLYMGARGGQTVVSNDPHFVAIALGRTALSTQGAYELLAYHHVVGDETTLEGVSRLAAGRQFLATTSARGSVDARTVPRIAHGYSDPASSRSVEDLAFDALRDSIADISPLNDPDRTCTLQISGGLDSRLTLAVLAETSSARPQTVTLDLSNTSELEIAEKVATSLGFPHRVERVNQMTINAARAGWALTGGQVSVHAAAGNILAYDTAEKDKRGEVTIVGAWPGDCLIGSYVPQTAPMLSRALRRWALRDWAVKREPLWRSRGVRVTGSSVLRTRYRARRSLVRALLRSPGRTAAQSISFWAMFERQPRFSYVSPAILSCDVLAVTPVLAAPYVSALLTLSPEQIIAKNFYRAMIYRRLPALRQIPNANTASLVTDTVYLPEPLPRTRPEIFQLLPASIQSVIRRVRPANHYLGSYATTETDFWTELLLREGVRPIVELDGVTVDASESGDLHVASVALGLSWSQRYLQDSYAELGAWEA